MSSPVISFTDVSMSYGERIALQDISFEMFDGEFVGIIGPNGSGKTTLFQGILGLHTPHQGTIRVLGKSPSNAAKYIRQSIGYLPQRDTLDPTVPGLVEDIVMMGLYSQVGLFRKPGAEHRKSVERVLSMVEMSDYGREPIGHLSGGQQQRVFLARALVSEPEILLLDEPTTAIDPGTQIRLIELITELQNELGLTLLFITHDVNHLLGRVDRVMYLNQQLHAFGPAEDILREEILSRVYGQAVHVIQLENGQPCVVVSDQHA